MSHALIESGLILIAESRFQRYWTSQEYRVVIDKVVFETRVKPSGDTLNAIIRMVQAKRVKVEVNAAAWLDDGAPLRTRLSLRAKPSATALPRAKCRYEMDSNYVLDWPYKIPQYVIMDLAEGRSIPESDIPHGRDRTRTFRAYRQSAMLRPQDYQGWFPTPSRILNVRSHF